MFLTLIFGKDSEVPVSRCLPKTGSFTKTTINIPTASLEKSEPDCFHKHTCLDLWTIFWGWEGGSAIKMLSFTLTICGLSRMTTLKGGCVLTKMFPDLYSDTLEIATQYFTSKGPSFPSTGEKSPKFIRYSPCG